MTHDIDYWRGLVAAAADVVSHRVTQFSPDGFGAWLGGDGQWWSVTLGKLVLTHNEVWRFTNREETSKRRQTYAHRTWEEALAALRKCVAPDEPAVAEILTAVYRGQKP